jgi:hypothetical protein
MNNHHIIIIVLCLVAALFLMLSGVRLSDMAVWQYLAFCGHSLCLIFIGAFIAREVDAKRRRGAL